jgi:hypothetical protein
MQPEFKITREIPSTLTPGAVERAVDAFVKESILKERLDVEPFGFYNQTLQRIAAATFLKTPGVDFWMAHAYGEVIGYAIANITTDIDMRLCYWVSQSWVAPEWRQDPLVKQSWENVRLHAEYSLCSHLVVVSCRNSKAFCRWLGGNFEPYATLLKEELGAADESKGNSWPYQRTNSLSLPVERA